MNDLKERILDINDIINFLIVRNLLIVDEEGYSFLTNQPAGKIIPLKFAIGCGYQNPLFKIKPTAVTQDGTPIRGYESIWVKEGLGEV